MPPPIRAHGRSLTDFDELLPAEETLLDSCRRGTPAVISLDRPGELTDDNHVRAGFVRFLALGGDENAPVHEAGVRLKGAWVAGKLDLEGATIDHRLALVACSIGEVDLSHASLRGLNLDGSMLVDRLTGDRLRCSGDFSLGGNFQSSGTIELFGATIDGDLICIGAELTASGDALVLDRATIGGSVFLREPFRAQGRVRLPGAAIRENLDLTGARLSADGDVALLGDRAKVGGSVILRDGFSSDGTVRLAGTSIEGDLDCEAAILTSPHGIAMQCDRAAIGGSIFLRTGFESSGAIRFFGTTVKGDLDCDSARLDGAGDGALSCNLMEVAGAFIFRNVTVSSGTIDLSSMTAAVLVDDLESWTNADSLILDGFSYGRLGGGAPTDAGSRLKWLRLQPPSHLGEHFKSQPWDRLEETLRAENPGEARTVALAKEAARRRAGILAPGERLLHMLYGALLGYGHQPWRLIRVMTSVWVVCGLIYWAAVNPRWFGSQTPLIAPKLAQSSTSPSYANFAPLVFSLDVLLPVVSLGEEEDWQPVVASEGAPWLWGYLVRLVYWFEIVFGWVAALQLLVVLARLVRLR